jgi:P27 family predicted phage terminase small subunit
MARPTKSSAELKASGTIRKDRHASRVENNIATVSELAPPPHYKGEYLTKWNEVVKHLADFKILANQDFDAICTYVETVIFQRMCMREFQTTGQITVESNGRQMQNPALKSYLQCDAILKPLREKFAFTPKDRQSVHIVTKDEKKVDPFKALMSPTAAKSKIG